LFLKIIGPLGSSIFINIAIIINIGENKITPIIHASISNILFKILHQSDKEVFFISRAGILLTRVITVLDFARSKEFAINLYFIQKILISSHNSSFSYSLYELAIYNISSIFLDFIIFLISSNLYLSIFLNFSLLHLDNQIISYSGDFMNDFIKSVDSLQDLLLIMKILDFFNNHLINNIFLNKLIINLSITKKILQNKNVNHIISLGISISKINQAHK